MELSVPLSKIQGSRSFSNQGIQRSGVLQFSLFLQLQPTFSVNTLIQFMFSQVAIPYNKPFLILSLPNEKNLKKVGIFPLKAFINIFKLKPEYRSTVYLSWATKAMLFHCKKNLYGHIIVIIMCSSLS